MPGVGRDLEATFVFLPDAVFLHQAFHPCLARRTAPRPQLSDHVRAAIRTFEFDMDGLNQSQHLFVGQAFPVRLAAAFPGTVAADADVQHRTHFSQGVIRALVSIQEYFTAHPLQSTLKGINMPSLFLGFRSHVGDGCFPPAVVRIPFPLGSQPSHPPH